MLRPFCNLWAKIFLFMFIIPLIPMQLMAKEVGRVTQVEGQVDIYQPPKTTPVPAKAQAGVQVNDRIKTEALSRCQLEFLDASTLTISPRSDIIIESYMFDAKKGEQGAIAKLTQGLVHLIVPVATLEKKEFLVKTSSAVMGIRGTELYILIGPEFTDVYVKSGMVAVDSNKDAAGDQKRSSMSPEALRYVERLAKQAQVRALARTGAGGIILGPMQASRVRAGQMPSPPVPLTSRHFATLATALLTGLPSAAILSASQGPAELLQTISEFAPAPAGPAGIGPTLPSGGPRSTGEGVGSAAQ